MAYSNNSVVTITDIGEGDMYCITSRSECCLSSDGGERGDWFLPGQDNAVKGTSTNDFSRRRARAQSSWKDETVLFHQLDCIAVRYQMQAIQYNHCISECILMTEVSRPLVKVLTHVIVMLIQYK